jgi:hypothetical protein
MQSVSLIETERGMVSFRCRPGVSLQQEGSKFTSKTTHNLFLRYFETNLAFTNTTSNARTMTKAAATSTKTMTATKAKGGTISKKGSSGSVSGPRLQILNATARLGRTHKGRPPKDQVAILAGYSNAGTAGFKKMLSTLKKEGHILYESSNIWLTEQGIEAAGPVEKVTTNEDFHNAIRETITTPKYRLAFDFLIDGRSRSKAELAEELGYPTSTTPGFKKMLSQIRKHAFVGTPGNDKDLVHLTDEAFPFGRPALFGIEEIADSEGIVCL